MKKQKLFQRVMVAILFTALAAGCSTLLPRDPSTLTPVYSTETDESTFTPTVSNTPSPSITPSPRPTKTATPMPEWVTNFSEPILVAIADRTPDYQDDFSQASQDWQREMMNCKDNGCVISNGVLSLSVNGRDSWAVITIPCYLKFKTFVLRVDVNTSKLLDENAAGFGYDNGYNHKGFNFAFEIKNYGRWWYFPEPGLPGEVSGQLPRPYPRILTLTIIVGDTKLAVYLNDTPVTLREFVPVANRTGLTLRAWSDGMTPAIVEYDNLKIWDLDNIPNLP